MTLLLDPFLSSLTSALRGFFGSGMMFRAANGMIFLCLILIAGWFVKFLLKTVGRRIISKTDLDGKILEIIIANIMRIVAITGIYVGLQEFSTGLTSANEWLIQLLEYCNYILYVLIALVVTAVSVKIADALAGHALRKIAERGATNFDHTFSPLINRMINILIAAIALIIVLDHFGKNVSSFVALLSVGSLAIGLAAQDTISNMISGFVIMLDRPFRKGDHVRLPSGEEGDIFEIGLRSTRIIDPENNLLILPNSELVKTRITNFSYPNSPVRVGVDVAVAYGSDVDEVKKMLLHIARSHPDVLKDPPPEVFLLKLGDSALQFKLVCTVESIRKQFKTGESLRVRIYQDLMNAGIEIPYPHQTIFIKSENSHNAFSSPRKRKGISR
jgi:MscS family membrane protein